MIFFPDAVVYKRDMVGLLDACVWYWCAVNYRLIYFKMCPQTSCTCAVDSFTLCYLFRLSKETRCLHIKQNVVAINFISDINALAFKAPHLNLPKLSVATAFYFLCHSSSLKLNFKTFKYFIILYRTFAHFERYVVETGFVSGCSSVPWTLTICLWKLPREIGVMRMYNGI